MSCAAPAPDLVVRIVDVGGRLCVTRALGPQQIDLPIVNRSGSSHVGDATRTLRNFQVRQIWTIGHGHAGRHLRSGQEPPVRYLPSSAGCESQKGK